MMAAGALAGIRVVDMTNFVAGPYCTMLLADMDAEVIKVEAPPLGDPSRYREDDSGYSTGFAAVNRNKKSVLLDLKSAQGRGALMRLLATADVFVVSLRPRSRRDLGISYEQLRERFPGLVYCSISGLGESGEATDRAAFDTTAQALSGILSLITSDFDKPVRITLFLADQLAGMYGCYGIMGALIARGRTGRGQFVGTSLLQASTAFATLNFFHCFAAERAKPKQGMAAADKSMTLRTAGFLFTGSDGKPFAIHVPPSPPKNWVAFTDALGRADLREDPRFLDKPGREKNYEALHGILAEEVKRHPRDHWLARLEEADVPCAPMYALNEVFHDRLIKSLGLLAQTTSPSGETELTVRSGVNLSENDPRVRVRGPLAGEHTLELVRELGYTETEIAELEKSGAIQRQGGARKAR